MKQHIKLNVMQIILNLELAGAQEVVRTLVDYLQSDDCALTVCAFEDGPLRQEIEKLGVKVELLERPRHPIICLPMFLLELRRLRRDLARLIETHKIDIIQTHLLGVLDFLLLTLVHRTNLRVVLWTIHNVDFLPTMEHWLLTPKRVVYRLLYRLTVNKVDGFIAVSDEVRNSMIRQIGPIQDKIITINNGVDVRRYGQPADKEALYRQLDIKPNSCLVATVGRLTLQKGHLYLIEAAAKIIPRFPNMHFLFVGDGELREELQIQARQAGISENIHFLGVREDVPEILMAVDIFALPSLWEGLSIALLEAMASGKPIVATAVSGTTQVMIPDETGLVIPPYDVQSLADAIIQLSSNPEQARVLGQAAKQHVETCYSAQKQANEHLALYQHLLFQQ